MITWKHFTLTLHALAVWTLAAPLSHGQQASSRLSTTFLARGEQALLEIAVTDGMPPDEMPEIPEVPDLVIQPSFRGQGGLLPGRRMEFVSQYIVAGYKVGKHVIPPIDVIVAGVATKTEPLEFEIFNPDELKWSEVEYAGRTVRYASSFRTLAQTPFENQTTPAEIKLFVPEEMMIEDWGIPNFQLDGVAAWRFQPSPMRSRINLLGQPYISIAYPSTLTPTRSGAVSIGPASIRLITREATANPFPQQVNMELYVQVPKLELESRTLPPNAPKDFKNAVGNFKIAVIAGETEVQEGDPLSVDLIVTGSGNLDTLSAPVLANAEGWKVYGSTTEQRSDERRQLSGSTVFHQSIRPLGMKSEIPSFKLVYFDPKTESYKTVLTEPVALTMSPSTAAPLATNAAVQSMAVPFERMSDILGILTPAQLTISPANLIPGWTGHVAGGLVALALILKALWMKFGGRLKKDPDAEARSRDLKQVERSKSASDAEYLRSAGSFIEHWLGSNPPPEIRTILAERDAVCFRKDQSTSVLNPKRRDEILKLLRRASVVCVSLAALFLATPVQAETTTGTNTANLAKEAYDSAKYEEAIGLWLGAGDYSTLSADTLYNIGNACYRAGSPGQAALYYYRALTRDSSHQEARQNLRFLGRKYGAITIQRQEFQYAIAKFPLSAWKAVCWGGIWLTVIALLVFPATRNGAGARVAAVVVLVISPLLIASGALGWRYFPTDSEFAPIAKQAVIVGDKVTLHTDAARTAPEVIDAPPGSLCQVLSQSGRWVYISFATKTRGWVPVESIEKVTPEKAPGVPKFSKPDADGKSA